MFADEPGEVAEVGGGSAVANRGEHRPLSNAKDVQRQRAHGNANHLLRVVEKLDRLSVEGKVGGRLVEEEVNRVDVQLETERFEEADVVGHHLLIVKVEAVLDDLVDVIVGEEVVERGLVADVLKENVQRLEELLGANVAAAGLLHDLQKDVEHVFLEEETRNAEKKQNLMTVLPL